MWTVVHQVPHRDLTAQMEFVALSCGGNGTTLTLSDSHMLYVAGAKGIERTPTAAHDVQVGCSPVPDSLRS